MAALLLAAAYNRFPLVFPDSAPYLGAAWAHAWPFDRAGFYGLAMMPVLELARGPTGLWLVIAIQCACVAAILLAVLRRMAPHLSTAGQVLIVAVLALGTALPWHAAQLMPDAMTGPLVLLTWLALWRDPTSPGSPLLWLAVVAAALVHWTHLPLMAAVAAITLLPQALSGSGAPYLVARRAVAAVIAIAAVAGLQVVGNGVTLDRWKVAPTGPVFLFARLNEDGLIPAWAARHCGEDAPQDLCELQKSLPRDSQLTLWRSKHINRLIWYGEDWERWTEMMGRANYQAVTEQPLAFAYVSLRAGASQFVHFETLNDECPEMCADPAGVLMHTIRTLRPELLPFFESSRQLQGELPKRLVRAINLPITLAGLLLLLPMMVVSWRRRDSLALSLLTAVLVALMANAFLSGALSNVRDRYQSRVVWLACFASIAAASRLAAPPKAISS